jgi:hypothetical protein
MRQTTHSTQVYSMFGGGYVPEQRTDEVRGNLAPSNIDEAVTSLTVSMLSEVMQSLRAALSFKSGRTAQ